MPVLKILNENREWAEVWGTTGGGGSATSASAPKLTTISMPASAWKGSDNLYSQVVSVSGVNANSKLDLQPTPAQIIALQDAETSLMATNNNGVVMVYAIGNKPTVDYTMKVLITEVLVV